VVAPKIHGSNGYGIFDVVILRRLGGPGGAVWLWLLLPGGITFFSSKNRKCNPAKLAY
jgi:hypothetical protein